MNEDWATEADREEPDFNMSDAMLPAADSNDSSSTDAAIEGEPFLPFDPSNIAVDKIVGLIFTAVVFVGAIVGLIFLLTTIGLNWILYSIAAVVLAIMLFLVFLSLAWPKIEHRHRSWRLTKCGLEIKHGVWWKHLQAVPWARVQHADVSQGPLQRMYGIGTLTVHTAGTTNSSVALTGLAHEQAVHLRDQIIRQRSSSDVV